MIDYHAKTRAALMLLLALLLGILAALELHHFHDRDYRQDEVNTVHAAQILNISETVQWMGKNGVHPAGWRVLATQWVKLVGRAEPATRYLSTLCTLIALALLYRLAADLFDPQTGLYAVFLLGTLPFAAYYMQELRPYAPLVLVTAGMQLSFLRWMRTPNFKYALLFVLFGVAGFQTHYFALYVVAAQAVVFVLLVRWDRGLYLRALGLFAAIGFSLLGWALPLANRYLMGSDKTYARKSSFKTLRYLYDQMQTNPPELGVLVVLAAVAIPVGVGYGWILNRNRPPGSPFRFEPEWRKLVVLIPPVLTLVAALIVNLFATTLTARNLIIILPSLAVLGAFTIRRLPVPARAALILLLAVPAVTEFKPPQKSNMPYWEIRAFMQPEQQPADRVLTHILQGSAQTQAFAYTLLDETPIPLANMFHVGGAGFGRDALNRLDNWVFNSRDENVARFAALLDGAGRVWYVRDREDPMIALYLYQLRRDFADARRATFYADFSLTITEYRRVPPDTFDQAVFGDAISLRLWAVPEGVYVQPCQTITVETWWRSRRAPGQNYGIGLVLIDPAGMGVAKHDAAPSGDPTEEWKPWTYHLDERGLTLPCDLPAGDYPLLVGWHDLQTAEPLPAAHPDGTPFAGNLVYLTTLFVGQ